ncbi:glycosyltransferase family 4 protein [Patescibacteria group bacterium]
MKILIDCRFWGPEHTGLGRYTKNLVLNLLNIDKKNVYYLLLNRSNTSLPELTNKKAEIISINIPHYSLHEQIQIPKILSKINPDLVHFPHFNVPLMYKGKFVVTIHDLIKHESKGMETTTRSPFLYYLKYLSYKQIFKKAVYGSEKIITPTKAIKKQLSTYYPKIDKKTKSIYEGVAKKLGKTVKASPPSKILKEFNLDSPYLLYVGNIYPHKNIRRLILALKLLNKSELGKKNKHLKLVVISSRDVFWQRLFQTVKEFQAESFVVLPGFVKDNDLKMFYQHARSFINPSLMEGFGLPGLEAMSLGCPVVCSNIPVFKEVYGSAALYFNPESMDDIKRKILKMYNLSLQERKKLHSVGLLQAKKYSWVKCAQETLKVYESCFSL